MFRHISAALYGVAEGALIISAHYKFEMDLTSFLLIAAGNPRWSSLYCTRGIELAPRLTNATPAEHIGVGKSSAAHAEGVLINSAHYKFEMDLTSFSLRAAEKPPGYSLFYERVIELATLSSSAAKPSWSSSICDRGLELAPLTSTAGKPSWSSFVCERGSTAEHYEPQTQFSCVIEPATLLQPATSLKTSAVLCSPLTTVLMKYNVKSTRYEWKSIPDDGNFFVYTVLSTKIFSRLIFISAQSLGGAPRSSCDAAFVPVPSLVSGVEWYAMVYSTAFSQKVKLQQADMKTLQNHDFLFLFSMVRPNESLLLDSCGPRRCIGVSIPAYPSGKYSAESETIVTLSLPTLKHSKGKYRADGTEVHTPATGTLKNSKYSAEGEAVVTIPTLKHRTEGMSLSETARETLFCMMMLLCLGVLIVNSEPIVASSWPLAHCLAHYRNQGQDVSRCCWVKVNTTSSHSDSMTKCINRDVVTSMRRLVADSGCTRNQGQKVSKCVKSR
jgi:hypothetical protein